MSTIDSAENLTPPAAVHFELVATEEGIRYGVEASSAGGGDNGCRDGGSHAEAERRERGQPVQDDRGRPPGLQTLGDQAQPGGPVRRLLQGPVGRRPRLPVLVQELDGAAGARHRPRARDGAPRQVRPPDSRRLFGHEASLIDARG